MRFKQFNYCLASKVSTTVKQYECLEKIAQHKRSHLEHYIDKELSADMKRECFIMAVGHNNPNLARLLSGFKFSDWESVVEVVELANKQKDNRWLIQLAWHQILPEHGKYVLCWAVVNDKTIVLDALSERLDMLSLYEKGWINGRVDSILPEGNPQRELAKAFTFVEHERKKSYGFWQWWVLVFVLMGVMLVVHVSANGYDGRD